MRVGIIGPTDVPQLAQFLGRAQELLVERGKLVGRIIAELRKDLWVNADGGMLSAVAQGYKDAGGVKLVMLLPRTGVPWPIDHALPYTGLADELLRPRTWFDANHQVVSVPEIVICVGLSSGTYSELSYIRWDMKLGGGNLKALIGIREFLRGGELPSEYRNVLAPKLRYIEAAEELREVLEEHQQREEATLP